MDGSAVKNMKRKFAGVAIVAVAAAALAMVPSSAFATTTDEHTVKVDFASTVVSPELAIHDTDDLLAFIASDQPKTIVIDTTSNAVTSVTG